ncbi:hypothetical protein [Paraburkholderia phenazinium]|jgi:hypothetical protein|uniref:Uncharacterized protein n=1 Tax=Paraburkholderia phenazinium TaxID=60549 RepID=A0A1G7SMI6_9BURK|nr:hypothetical protein [Paraburkholderia phenazinium]SDG24122.1 hypothetical protein SAMN05216466_102578 [Paraburkholderia phenazinium]
MKVPLQGTKVFRSVITSGAQFEEYLEQIGRPRFAVSCGGDDPGGAQAGPDEWLFADDIDCLMRAFLDWDARGIRMEFDQPTTGDADVAASWTVVGLPAHFNDATSNLNSGLLGVMCKAMGADGARRAFLEAVFNDGWVYDFVALRANRYDSFIEEWKSDDDKNARPEHYRAQKNFGVVIDAGGLGVGSRPLQYWVYIGVASGSLTAQQLKDAGLTCEGLIGQACVINGLGEVERIGNHRVMQCDLA